MKYQVLLIEDDERIQEIVMDFFHAKSEGEMAVTLASSGAKGLEKTYEKEYDLILLDVMMPGMDGFSVCREIRKRSIVPIIFITARIHEEDIMYGYDLGCDDYITKPFSLNELYAKARAMVKRSKGLVGCELLRCGEISVNPATFVVKVKDQEVELPPKQYALLKYLLEHKEKVVSREALLDCIWGYDYEGTDRVVDNHIKKLRMALQEGGKYIKTIITKGYKLTEKVEGEKG